MSEPLLTLFTNRTWTFAVPVQSVARILALLHDVVVHGTGNHHQRLVYQQHLLQGVHQILCFFARNLESLPPRPRQHSAAIGCTKNYQPIRVTVHSHCTESFEGLLQRCRRGRCCSEL